MKSMFLVIGGWENRDYSRKYTQRNMMVFANKQEAEEFALTFWDFEKKEGYINFVEIKEYDLYERYL